jgi:hypothetical protein
MKLRAGVSFAAMQLAWFVCVLGSTRAHPWLGPGVVVVLLTVHVARRGAGRRGTEIVVLAMSALLGFAVDTALLRSGVIARTGTEVSPPWLIALWPNVAATTAKGGSLAFLAERPWVAAFVGGFGGALSYDAGSRLGALGLGANPWWSLGVIGVVWTSVLPILFWLRATRGRNASLASGARGIRSNRRDR